MPRRAKELKAIQVKGLSKPGRHAVGGTPAGLSLSITDAGAKSWIFRVTVGRNRRHIGLGSYPEVSLAEARQKAVEMKRKINSGIDPVEERAAERAALEIEQRQLTTFKEAFNLYYETKVQGEFRNAKHIKQWRSTLTTYAFPVIGDKAVASITVEDVLAILSPIWTTKNETASRVRQRIEAVLDWAIAKKLCEGENPARWKANLQPLLPAPEKVKRENRQPAIILDEIGDWFRILRTKDGIAARALEFLTLTASRSGEVRGALWDEFDLANGIWTVPEGRMKARREHRVPLSSAAVALLKKQPRLMGCEYVFPSPRNGQMSDMTISAVMRRIQAAEEKDGRRGFLDQRSRRSTPLLQSGGAVPDPQERGWGCQMTSGRERAFHRPWSIHLRR